MATALRSVYQARSEISQFVVCDERGKDDITFQYSHQDWNGRELVEFFRRVGFNFTIPKVQPIASPADEDQAGQVRWRVLDREREVGNYPVSWRITRWEAE